MSEQADPVAALLTKAPLADSQRAGLWDLYQAAKDEHDLAERLKTLQLPDAIKADLWDLKAQRPKEEPTPQRSVLEMGITRATSDSPDQPPSLGQRVVSMGQGMAHPSSLGDVVSLALPVKGMAAGAESAAPAVGRRLESGGANVLKMGESPAFKKFSGRVGLIELLRSSVNPKELALAVGAMSAPALTRSAGRGMMSAGKVLSRSGAAPVVAEEAASTVTQGLKAYTVAEDLAGDVTIIRDMAEKAIPPADVIKVIAGPDRGYASKLTAAWKAAVKSDGLPVPESVKQLMQSPSFARLPK